MKLLEVIVTSVEEACEAEEGGAGRLELVRDLASEGLTPSPSIVEQVLAAVSIPVRVMLRETDSFYTGTESDAEKLKDTARIFSQLPIDGLVLGFLNGQSIDLCMMQRLLAATGDKPITFHRAIESVTDPYFAIELLKAFLQVDRILLNGGDGSWIDRRSYLEDLQEHASPQISLIVGGGLDEEGLEILAQSPLLNEFHTGSAVRDQAGRVRSDRVRKLFRLLGTTQ